MNASGVRCTIPSAIVRPTKPSTMTAATPRDRTQRHNSRPRSSASSATSATAYHPTSRTPLKLLSATAPPSSSPSNTPRRPNSIGRGVFDGLLLGGTVALSSFNGVLLVGWYAVAEVALLALDRGRELWRWVLSRGVAAVIVLGFVGLTMALGMVQRTPDAFIWGWNRYFLHGPWTFILLSFGPALFLAPLGLVRVASRSI